MNESQEPRPRRRRRLLLILTGVALALSLTIYRGLLSAEPIALEAYPALELSDGAISERRELSFSVLHTGFTDSLEAMIFRGGSLFATHRTQHAGVLIRHPKGLVMLDGGLGAEAPRDLASMPWWIRPMFRFEDHRPAREQIKEAGLDPDAIGTLVLTHMHWDHASAIHDFPKATVVTTQEEWAHATGDEAEAPSFIKRQYADRPEESYRFVTYPDGPYEGFEKSQDLFGDGSIVLVPMPGHTPGALALFLNCSADERFLFVGDTVWAAKAIPALAEKMPVARWLADGDPEGVRHQIVRLHRLQKQRPELTIVPAHDGALLDRLPRFPKFGPR